MLINNGSQEFAIMILLQLQENFNSPTPHVNDEFQAVADHIQESQLPQQAVTLRISEKNFTSL